MYLTFLYVHDCSRFREKVHDIRKSAGYPVPMAPNPQDIQIRCNIESGWALMNTQFAIPIRNSLFHEGAAAPSG